MSLLLTNHYVFRNIVHETLLVPVSPNLRERDCLYVLNPVARVLYEELKKATPRQILKERILAEFSLSAEDQAALESDIEAFVADLCQIEALTESSDVATPAQ